MARQTGFEPLSFLPPMQRPAESAARLTLPWSDDRYFARSGHLPIDGVDAPSDAQTAVIPGRPGERAKLTRSTRSGVALGTRECAGKLP
jgi:hypothetical protein